MPSGIPLLFSPSYLFSSTVPCFLLLLCTGVCSSMGCSPLQGVPALAWVIHGHSPSGVSLLQCRSPMTAILSEAFVLMAWSFFFQEYVSSCVPNSVLFCVSARASSHISLSCASSLLSFCVSFHVFPHNSSGESTCPAPCSFYPFLIMSQEWCCVFPSLTAVLGHSGVFPMTAEPRAHGLLPHRC